LVALKISDDDEFLDELRRLCVFFGIGVIALNAANVEQSEILFVARRKEYLDWETINKLCEQNAEFERFLQDVKIDFESKRVHRAEYDEVVKDIGEYIEKRLKIEQGS